MTGVQVTGPIATTVPSDTYPTHNDQLGLGGFRPVADKAARLAITTDRREAGMLVYQIDTNAWWQLRGGIADSNWVEVPYVSPTFSSFLITGVTILEVGDAISGTKTFTWGTTKSADVKVNSVDILDITGSATLETGLANSGSKAHAFSSPIQLIVAGSYNFRIQALNILSSSFTKDLFIYWQWMVYYGESLNTSLTEAQIKALRVSGLQSGFAGTYSFLGGGYKYLAWPIVLGVASSFKDASNSLNIVMESPVIVSVTNSFGITTDYYVYRTTNILGGPIDIVVV